MCAGLAVVVRPDAVAVRRAEVPGDPLPFYGGLELGDAAFLILVSGILFIGSSAAAVAPRPPRTATTSSKAPC